MNFSFKKRKVLNSAMKIYIIIAKISISKSSILAVKDKSPFINIVLK